MNININIITNTNTDTNNNMTITDNISTDINIFFLYKEQERHIEDQKNYLSAGMYWFPVQSLMTSWKSPCI